MSEEILSLKTKIICLNWREVAAFYRQQFGMETVEQWDEANDKGAILAFPDRREVLLELYDGPASDLGGVSLQFRVEDVDAFAAKLDPSIDRDGPSDRPWGARYLILADPAGVRIVVYSGRW